MRQIDKQEEPQTFILWKAENQEEIQRLTLAVQAQETSADTLWKILPSSPNKDATTLSNYAKSELRTALVQEQFYLCCYCNDKVKGEPLDTKIEHFLPKESHIQSIFEYKNLLAACSGGEKLRPALLHCDSEKGNKYLEELLSPLEENVHSHFSYNYNGRISSSTERGEKTIEFLNLDSKNLRIRREEAISDYLYNEEMSYEEKVAELSQPIDGELTPFCMAILSVLKDYE